MIGFFSDSRSMRVNSVSSSRTAGAITEEEGAELTALLSTKRVFPAARIRRRLRSSRDQNSQPRTSFSRPSAIKITGICFLTLRGQGDLVFLYDINSMFRDYKLLLNIFG